MSLAELIKHGVYPVRRQRSMNSVLTGAAIGDSIASYATSDGKGWANRGFLTWVRRYCGSRVNIPASNVFATAGFTIQAVINTWLAPCIAARPDFVIVHVGTNSIGEGTTANLQAQYQYLYDALTNAGIIAIIHPILVTHSAFAWAGDDLLQVCALNSFTENYCRNNLKAIYSNVNPLLTDYATGNGITADFYDGLHPTLIGAMKIGRNDAEIINQFAANIDDRGSMAGDIYHATQNPSGNLLVNGLLAGSQSGTLQNGATGDCPTDWYCGPEIGASTASCAFSKTAYPGRTGLERATMTIGGTADNNPLRIFQTINPLLYSAGDTIKGECEVDWNITTGASFGNIGLRIFAQTAGFSVIDETHDGWLDGFTVYPTGTGSALLRVDEFVIPANTGNLSFSMQVYPGATGSVAAVVNWARARLQKR